MKTRKRRGGTEGWEESQLSSCYLNSKRSRPPRAESPGDPLRDRGSRSSRSCRSRSRSHSGLRRKKWNTLIHRGPCFAPPYVRLPNNVKFCYNGHQMHLSSKAEEVATFYARMYKDRCANDGTFKKNFFTDWRGEMQPSERSKICELRKCDFKYIYRYLVERSKCRSKHEKQRLKETNERLMEQYGYCLINGVREKIGNFKIEPPGLFRGRGNHPKRGRLKKRVLPEDVTINCSNAPPAPRLGGRCHKWKEVRHDNTVTWLACWKENILGGVKYTLLNSSSRLKCQQDEHKYELARKLHKYIHKIRKQYRAGWRSKDLVVRQLSVALYFIDQLALRAGNEKGADRADTVGCCSLKVKHVKLKGNGRIVLDFPGKDSIRYCNTIKVDCGVYNNLKQFLQRKNGQCKLFDKLNTMTMNRHLGTIMQGLTAKVFRTYNASLTLQSELDKRKHQYSRMSAEQKVFAYNDANRAVARLCNHQRAVPKMFGKMMKNMDTKIQIKKKQIKAAECLYHNAKKDCSRNGPDKRKTVEKRRAMLERLKLQLQKLCIQAEDREKNKSIALGTSKLNYLDPRITVSWCKKYNVPMERIYNKTQRSKFAWAIKRTPTNFKF